MPTRCKNLPRNWQTIFQPAGAAVIWYLLKKSRWGWETRYGPTVFVRSKSGQAHAIEPVLIGRRCRVGELVLADRALGGHPQRGPVGHGQRNVCAGQNRESQARRIGETDLKSSVCQPQAFDLGWVKIQLVTQDVERGEVGRGQGRFMAGGEKGIIGIRGSS